MDKDMDNQRAPKTKIAEYVIRINGQDHGITKTMKEAKDLVSDMNIHDSLVKVEILKRIDKVLLTYVPKVTKILVAEELGLE